jgi:hypothetical protein
MKEGFLQTLAPAQNLNATTTIDSTIETGDPDPGKHSLALVFHLDRDPTRSSFHLEPTTSKHT